MKPPIPLAYGAGHTTGFAPMAIILLLICTLSFSSCYRYRIASTGDPDNSTFVKKKTQMVYLWGLVQGKDVKADCEGIHKVRVTTNAGFILLSVVTVGIVVPQKIEWVCAVDTPPADTLRITPTTPKIKRRVN